VDRNAAQRILVAPEGKVYFEVTANCLFGAKTNTDNHYRNNFANIERIGPIARLTLRSRLKPFALPPGGVSNPKPVVTGNEIVALCQADSRFSFRSARVTGL
jgi:hypothetical protein